MSKAIEALGVPVETKLGSETLAVTPRVPFPVTIVASVEKATAVRLYCSFRTDSYDLDGIGGRSDLHEIIPTMMAVALRRPPSPMSCALIFSPNQFSGLQSEIYAGAILPAQPGWIGLPQTRSTITLLEHLVAKLWFGAQALWEVIGCPCRECRLRRGVQTVETSDLPDDYVARVRAALGANAIDESNHGRRPLPKWDYFHHAPSGSSIVASESLCQFVREMTPDCTKVESVDGQLWLEEPLRNAVPFVVRQAITRTLTSLDGVQAAECLVLPLENTVIGVGRMHLVFMNAEAGEHAFKTSRELLRRRNARERELLFRDEPFRWADPIDPEEFESLIRSLLEREPGVRWVRRVSPTNQPDRGRDLIAEFAQSDGIASGSEVPRARLRRVVVQCKADTRSVGKSRVQDIRDTIEHHGCSGFFLAVASTLTAPLTEELELLRNSSQFWSDWWTREEIESRLRQHADVASRYRSIVRLRKAKRV